MALHGNGWQWIAMDGNGSQWMVLYRTALGCMEIKRFRAGVVLRLK